MKRLAMISVLSFLFGCAQQQSPRPGSLCSVDDGEGSYRVAKILMVDEQGVHIRLYKNKWKERPKTIDASALTLGSIKDGNEFGMGHLPLTKKAFAAWKPVVISEQEVKKDELDGYELWKDGGGSYFGGK
jgi:hypothetical protein